VLERAFDADVNVSEDTKRFIDRHMTPGEKRPPAPSVRNDTGAWRGVPSFDKRPQEACDIVRYGGLADPAGLGFA
jgi:hypothetical protein